jgi:hypothetical protein
MRLLIASGAEMDVALRGRAQDRDARAVIVTESIGRHQPFLQFTDDGLSLLALLLEF